MATNNLRVVYTTSDKLPEITLSPAMLIFCEDNRSIQFVNKDNEVINYQSVISLNTDAGRIALSHPYPALYWVKNTNILWRYDADGGWIQVTFPPTEQLVFSVIDQFPAVGQENMIYVDGIHMYRYIDNEYKLMNSGGGSDLTWLPIN